MAKNNKINFALISIKELEFRYKNPIEIFPDFTPEKYPLEVKINVNYRWNMDKDLFGVVIDLFYLIKDKNNRNIELVKLSFITEFFIEKLKEVFTVRTKNDFDLDEKFESTLVGLAISTGRGILFEKTTGTVFNDFIFPVVNPMELILSKKFKKAKK